MALGASARVAMMHSLTHNEGLADMLGEAVSRRMTEICQHTIKMTASSVDRRAAHCRARCWACARAGQCSASQ